MQSRCAPATWVGAVEATGENIVVANGPEGAAFRVRTVARRPLEERWDAEASLAMTATARVPAPRARPLQAADAAGERPVCAPRDARDAHSHAR